MDQSTKGDLSYAQTDLDTPSADFLDQHNELGVQLLNIKISEKVQVMFNVHDPVYKLKESLDRDMWEELELWSRCGSCGEQSKKLRNCEFCGQLTCPNDLNHQRLFPNDNQGKLFSTQVCLTCNSKFLYRDAMFEMVERLSLKDQEL